MRGDQGNRELQGDFFITMHMQMDPKTENGEILKRGLRLLLECCQRMDSGVALVPRNVFRQLPNLTAPDDPNFPVFTNEMINYCKPTNLQLLRQAPIDPVVLQKRINNKIKGPTKISAHVKICTTLHHPSWISDLVDAISISMARQHQISVHWKNIQCWDSTVGVEITGLHEDADEEVVQSALYQIVTGEHSSHQTCSNTYHLKSVPLFRVYCCKKQPQVFKVEAEDDAWPWLFSIFRRIDTKLHNLVVNLLNPMSDQYLRERWDDDLEHMRKSILQKSKTRVSIRVLTRVGPPISTPKQFCAGTTDVPSSSTFPSISPTARLFSSPGRNALKTFPIHNKNPTVSINQSPSAPTSNTISMTLLTTRSSNMLRTSPTTMPSDFTFMSSDDSLTAIPKDVPSISKTDIPTNSPSEVLSLCRSGLPSYSTSDLQSTTHNYSPSSRPRVSPTASPSDMPSSNPTKSPIDFLSTSPRVPLTVSASELQSPSPTKSHSGSPSSSTSVTPAASPSDFPSSSPSVSPTANLSDMSSFGTRANVSSPASPSDSPSKLSPNSKTLSKPPNTVPTDPSNKEFDLIPTMVSNASQSSSSNNLPRTILIASLATTFDAASFHTLQRTPLKTAVQPPLLLNEYRWLGVGLWTIKQSNLAKRKKDLRTSSRWRGFSWEGFKTNCSHHNSLPIFEVRLPVSCLGCHP